jgi:hypothetical protein
MEGINASSLRKVLGIPSRYAIPLIVCTGAAPHDDNARRREMAASRRYPISEVVFANAFGMQMSMRDV